MAQVIALDVNETLLDLSALDPDFERVFGSVAHRPQWFAQMLQLAFVATITGEYVDFTTAQRAALAMVAERAGVQLAPDDADAIVGGMRRLPPHPEVRGALQTLRASGLRTCALTNSTLELAEDHRAGTGGRALARTRSGGPRRSPVRHNGAWP